MRRVLIFLGLSLIWIGLTAPVWAEPKILTRDGSLVIENSKKIKKSTESEDSLCELLGQEVQVYIFNKKTQVWPRVYTLSSSASGRTPAVCRDPGIEALIHKYSLIYGVDPSLVRAVMRHESGFNPGAVSPKGAQGLMQLMPGTAALMGVNNPFDPEQNIAGGVGYLRRCLDRFQHNVPLAVAAYNAGPESVARCGAIPPYQETQTFVTNVMGSYTGPSAAGNIPTPPKNKAKMAKKETSQYYLQSEKTPDAPRRPRPKIIEVRSYKSKPLALEIE